MKKNWTRKCIRIFLHFSKILLFQYSPMADYWKKVKTVKLNHWRMKLVQNDNSIELTFCKSEWTFQKHGLQLIVVKSPYFVEQKVYILQETSGHKVQVVSKIWKHKHSALVAIDKHTMLVRKIIKWTPWDYAA